MWYMADYSENSVSLAQFIRSLLSVFSNTLTAVSRVPVFAFFLAFAVLAVAFGLWLRIAHAAEPGGKKR